MKVTCRTIVACSGVVTLAALLLSIGSPARAQLLSGINPTLNAGNSANEFTTANPSYERRSQVGLASPPTATSFSTRYFGLVSADSGLFGNARTETLNSSYTVSFFASAPGAYRLTVASRLTGDMHLIEDNIFVSGHWADVTALTGSFTGGSLTSGGLSLADPGRADDIPLVFDPITVAFNSTTAAQIFAVSNGTTNSHSLTFTWSQTAFSPGGGDEAAVRLGGTSNDTTETAADYPGNPARDQANDGHFVTVTLTSLCGNGVIDSGPSYAEQCDEGPLNGLGGSCCMANCQFRPANDVCRLAAAGCDQQEVCTGSSGSCPADGVKPSGTVCRAGSAGEICDVTETCDGVNAACPPDQVQPATTVCRNSAGVCDLAENCTGASKFCPADAKSTAVCRGSAGVCDLAESCNGIGNDCPADAKSTTLCRGSAGSCDVAESCNGVSNTCPSDQFQPSSTVCRVSILSCDVAENCTGSGPNCPADALVPNGTACPGDGNVCTVDKCDGVSKFCQHPAGNAGTICRAGTPGQVCDVTEVCDGVNTACPADESVADGTPCTDDGFFCTGTETCQSGTCAGSGDPCTLGSCDESGDQCLAAGCQAGPLAGCRQALKSLFVVKDSSTDSRDKLLFKWVRGDQADKSDLADPTSTANYNLCVYTGATEDLVGDAQVGPSTILWAENSKGYIYRDLDGTQSGIQKIVLKAGAQGKTKAQVKGRGVNLPDLTEALNSSLDLDPPVRVQLVNSDNGQCLESTFDAGGIRTNEPGRFKGKASN